MENIKESGAIQIVWTTTIIFMTLKFTKQIDWSWWAVTSPLWVCGIILLLLGVVMIIFYAVDKWKQ